MQKKKVKKYFFFCLSRRFFSDFLAKISEFGGHFCVNIHQKQRKTDFQKKKNWESDIFTLKCPRNTYWVIPGHGKVYSCPCQAYLKIFPSQGFFLLCTFPSQGFFLLCTYHMKCAQQKKPSILQCAQQKKPSISVCTLPVTQMTSNGFLGRLRVKKQDSQFFFS